jgi:acyl carrier protein
VPIPDLCLHLLDESGQRVAPGEPGEIYVGGAGVARGYLKRPELTAERFVRDPWSSDANARLYRSGDLAIELPDGDLMYVGRRDAQLKIRGYRIESAEIESCLQHHRSVASALVMARDHGDGDKALVAYVVPLSGHRERLVDELRALVAMQLPEYMRPAAYVTLSEFPLTAHGKVDRARLPPPDRAAFVGARTGEPSRRQATTSVEKTLAAIWQNVLRVPQICLDDDFFELGGTSLSAVRVLIAIQEQLGISLDVSLWAEAATIAGFADACFVLRKEPIAGDRARPVSRSNRRGEMP